MFTSSDYSVETRHHHPVLKASSISTGYESSADVTLKTPRNKHYDAIALYSVIRSMLQFHSVTWCTMPRRLGNQNRTECKTCPPGTSSRPRSPNIFGCTCGGVGSYLAVNASARARAQQEDSAAGVWQGDQSPKDVRVPVLLADLFTAVPVFEGQEKVRCANMLRTVTYSTIQTAKVACAELGSKCKGFYLFRNHR